MVVDYWNPIVLSWSIADICKNNWPRVIKSITKPRGGMWKLEYTVMYCTRTLSDAAAVPDRSETSREGRTLWEQSKPKSQVAIDRVLSFTWQHIPLITLLNSIEIHWCGNIELYGGRNLSLLRGWQPEQRGKCDSRKRCLEGQRGLPEVWFTFCQDKNTWHRWISAAGTPSLKTTSNLYEAGHRNLCLVAGLDGMLFVPGR